MPLAILESIRKHDRPTEVLQDEDLTASLPRRLGLTGVVESQIHRYQIARRRRERIPREDVANLLRLVLRRPDAEPILRHAGRSLAAQHAGRPFARVGGLGRFLPDAFRAGLAKRVIHRLMHRIAGGSVVRVTRDPFRVEITDSVTAINPPGVACIFYGAAIEAAYGHATGQHANVEHTECTARGDAMCVWEVR